MLRLEDFPKTLPEFEERFGTDEACREYLLKARWPDGWRCPRCGHPKGWTNYRQVIECGQCHHQVSLTAGTVLHSTKKPLRLWFRVMFLVVTQKNGLSAKTVERIMGFSYSTAWTWLHKLRDAMVNPGRQPLSGTVQVDESYIGAMTPGMPGRHRGLKSLVAIAVEETGYGMGRARLTPIWDASAHSLHGMIEKNVASGSIVHTDGWPGYKGLEAKGYPHRPEPLQGDDKALSSFWPVHQLAGLLRRWLLGTHQGAVRDKHLAAYLNEFVFRFNRRRSRSRTLLFQRLACQGMMQRARPYWRIIRRSARNVPLRVGPT